MNHPDGKRLLAAVRDGDYAHAGEEEAIRLTWKRLPENPTQLCLDAGCGRGGTAAFVQRSGWGKVTGADTDAETITNARAAYPAVEFQAADVKDLASRFPARFDLIYAFNAFYAFPDQTAALHALAGAAKADGKLCLFDYVDRGDFAQSPFRQYPETLLWQPLQLETLPALLQTAGWRVSTLLPVHEEFRRWYADLNQRFQNRQEDLLRHFPEDLVRYAAGYYRSLLQAIEDGALGGAIVYADRL
ncbi:MAG: class I SAM-dependent methyltransferase [Terrimicrobiaceae bacterium]